MDELAAVKQRMKATWGAGNFDEVAELIWGVGARVVEAAQIDEGDRVLDIGAGTGNASIPAAERGAEVTASDLAPEMFPAGRARAAEAGVELEWIEADAEDLPFDDQSFDVVISVFGHMFAPRHELAGAELARVLRPEGRLALACWRPDGRIGTFMRTIAAHVPTPPDFVKPPPLWGDPEHARAMIPESVELRFDDDSVRFEFGSAESAVEFYSQKFGPLVMARKALEEQGRWEQLHDELVAFFETETERVDGGLQLKGQFTLIRGRKAG